MGTVMMTWTWRTGVLLAVVISGCVAQYTESHCRDQKQAIVHLFEWPHDAVADECEKVLGPKGTVWAVFTTRDGAWLMVCMHLCLLTTMTTSVDMVVVAGSWLHKMMLGLIR